MRATRRDATSDNPPGVAFEGRLQPAGIAIGKRLHCHFMIANAAPVFGKFRVEIVEGRTDAQPLVFDKSNQMRQTRSSDRPGNGTPCCATGLAIILPSSAELIRF